MKLLIAINNNDFDLILLLTLHRIISGLNLY